MLCGLGLKLAQAHIGTNQNTTEKRNIKRITMTSKAKPNVRGKEAKMPLDSKKRPTFQAGLSFEHYVRSSQRKQWNSLIPLCKELVDNSRDAEAENVYFDFYNYKGQTRVSDSGGIISYLDDGRGLALKILACLTGILS